MPPLSCRSDYFSVFYLYVEAIDPWGSDRGRGKKSHEYITIDDMPF